MSRIDVERARAAIADVALRTPLLPAEELSALSGGEVMLKAECLQRTGSFKIRGVLAKIAATHEPGALITASAGNHGQAVAYAARVRGVSCEVFMPLEAAVSKVASVERLGGSVSLVGEGVDEAIDHAIERAAETGATFVHPFDDLDVVAGQGTIGLELLEDAPDLACILVPLGGGGLASGIAAAVKAVRPTVSVIGVQASACAPYVGSLGGGEVRTAEIAPTIADGIAVKRPGRVTLPLLREFLDDVCAVDEEEIAEGMVFLADRAKLVAEGAGAVGVAALLAGKVVAAPDGATAVIVSGGNVDLGLLAGVLRRRETELGRRIRVYTRVPDRPGGLAELLGLIAECRANLLTIEHLRDAAGLHVRETGVELTLETRGPDHTAELLARLREAGYTVELA